MAVSATALWLGVGACQSDGDSEQAGLQALLHDEPLQQAVPSAVTSPPRAVSSLTAPGAALADASGSRIGSWDFDDCSPDSTELRDSIFDDGQSNTAFRAVNAACVSGIRGQGVALARTEDIVYVPDQPSFRFEGGVTVGGWFKPAAIGGTRTLIRKRDHDTSSFALVLTGGKFRFIASFGDGRAASVTAPSKARVDVFQHVAATYDNVALRLYIDGVEVTRFDVAGTIPVGAGPLLLGNDGSERRFDGTIDQVTFATRALPAADVLQLTCLPELPTVALPSELPPTPIGVPVTIDVALTNHNPAGACAPVTFGLTMLGGQGVDTDPPPFTQVSSAPVASGETTHMTIKAAPGSAVEPGDTVPVSFFVSESTTGFFETRTLLLPVAATEGCQVLATRELMITSTSVVDDPVRTQFDPASSDPRNGAWTLKRLLENMAPAAADAPGMFEAVIASFNTAQTVNGFRVAPRPGMRGFLASWPRTPDGKLDLARAPFRLQAIVNRFDLRHLSNGDAGEGRFVFAFNDASGAPQQATLILEYKLPAASDQDVLGWAQSFHALGALDAGEGYNTALQAITDRFTGRGARPGHPNGSAINSVRTNEISFGGGEPWELRQFGLSAGSGMLEPQPVELTVDRSFNNSATLASYINANQDAIITETHVVPAVFNGQPFVAGSILNDLSSWFAPGVDPEARHHFALNTCSGCHSTEETGVSFLQISPRAPGGQAQLSGFLTGTTIPDPVTRAPRVFNDLRRRKLDLEAIVCTDRAKLASSKLREGIRRVH